MYFNSAIRCDSCLQRFSETRKPCIGSCSHTICVPCKKKLKEFECPICDLVGAFKDVEPNYAALEMAKQLQDKLKTNDFWAFVPKEEDITMGPCSECSELTRKLRLCTECAEKDGLIRQFEGMWIIISQHPKYDREFLRIKSKAICSDCAIDGAHEGHRIEMLYDALEHNFFIREVQTMKIDFAHLKKLLKWNLFCMEIKKNRPFPCVFRDDICCAIPEVQAKIVEVRERLKKKVRKNEKMKERLHTYQLEFLDLLTENFKRRGPKESEVQELEAIRAKFPKWKYLTEKDVLKIDERLIKKMALFDGPEAFEVARKAEHKVFEQKADEMLKFQFEHDEARHKCVNCSPDMAAFNKVFLDYVATGINLTGSLIKFHLASEDLLLDQMMIFFGRVISVRLCHLLLFNLVPWNPSDNPPPDLSYHFPFNLRQ